MTVSLNALAGRLTDPADREAYAALVSYFDSLPHDDEIFRLVHLLGLLSLLGQRIPDSLGEILVELRTQAAALSIQHSTLSSRLSTICSDISAGIDTSAIARAMAESVRQAAGAELQDVRSVAMETTTALRVLLQNANGVTAALEHERGRITESGLVLAAAADALDGSARGTRAWLLGIVGLVGFLAGVLGVLVVLIWRG